MINTPSSTPPQAPTKSLFPKQRVGAMLIAISAALAGCQEAPEPTTNPNKSVTTLLEKLNRGGGRVPIQSLSAEEQDAIGRWNSEVVRNELDSGRTILVREDDVGFIDVLDPSK